MSAKKMTREELLLIQIFQARKQPVDAIEIGKALNLSERGLKQSLHLLTHGNCIRRLDEQYVVLTEHGKIISQQLINPS